MTMHKITFVFALLLSVAYAQKKIFCYYGSWAVYRPSAGKFPIDKINPHNCTHLIYAFAGLHENGNIKVLDPWNDINLQGYTKFNNLKSNNPNLKTLIAVGGWNAGSVIFSSMASNPEYRQNFIQSTKIFMNNYKFDGVEIAWLYPGQRGGKSADKINFVTLIQQLKAAISPNYLLTVAVSGMPPKQSIAYDISELSKYVDYLNVMTYDLHSLSEPRTGPNAALFSPLLSFVTSVSSCINKWMDNAPRAKIIMGIPAYGRSFTLEDTNDVKIGAPTIGYGITGEYSQEPGVLTYNEICIIRKREVWNYKWNDNYKTPYIYKDNQWISFDDGQSVYEKAKYIKHNNLGGAAIWSIDMDPVDGPCQEVQPILTKIKEGLA